MSVVSPTIAEATEYFEERLYVDAWDDATTVNKTKALAQAARDIGNLTITGTPGLKLKYAICEQALYLLEQTASDRERVRAQQGGVNFRWVGDAREDYKGKIQRISPDALQHLKGYVQRIMGGIR